MKKIILAISVVLSITVTSCQQTKNNDAEKTTSPTVTTEQKAASPTIEDKIVSSSITNKEGVKLDMVFNNTKKTATLVFKGETIELKQDTMGSGVKYSNDKYLFSDWHGQTELKKKGKTIFKNIEDGKVQKK